MSRSNESRGQLAISLLTPWGVESGQWDALALLKAALRIPTGPVEAPDPADVTKTALVRR